ncbi:XAC2610-related protein [Flavobacterium artemisiae]|uniref:XAC2610-related protein n=1 Tax=Flavobacterium artemisiae TaxID=2126556 RepID=A0ABW4H9K6_9FLAO
MKPAIGFLLLLVTGFNNLHAQKAYLINDFMKGYTLYFVQQDSKPNTKEYYTLTENTSKKTVLEFGTKELSNPQIKKTAKIATFKSIPNINIHVLGDVNFDGREDILIDGTELFDEGCYNPRPSSSIFINTANSFVYNQSISSVYEGAYCLRGGSFEIDSKYKRLITSSSGGALIRGYEYYSVTKNEAKLISSFEIEASYPSPFSKITGKKLENNKWVSFTSLSLYEEGLEKDKLLAFDTKNGKGRVILFKVDDVLYYVFQQNDEYKFVSFAHPSIPEKADKALFKFTKQNISFQLEFNSGSIKYIIYETPNEVGIKIYVNGKLSDWQGTAKAGSLSALGNLKFKNMFTQ